ncbi:NAD kinase [Crocinitomicaceae bacterium]|jgi:NAD+ kinase|nr:NAD kinase [Crocinitomicaceae bacterium]MDG1347611.1 NAD kinase [Crocinitomicaceae bacterium]MDG2465392.1 NAD kinase [Crocinitomicaceae bacterium]
MKNIAIYARKVTKQNIAVFNQLFSIFEKLGWNAILEDSLKMQLMTKAGINPSILSFNSYKDFSTGIDLAISMGGDGTFIQTVKYIRNSGVPIIGINTGRLGFLANVSTEKMEETLEAVKRKEFVYQSRSLMKLDMENNPFGDDNVALNEITLHKKDAASMITVDASLAGKYLNSYWADGLIVATPTGSTAYNLSCGGPIVTPGCQVHMLTPIAPHNLNVRPMVVPDHLPISLTVQGRERRYLVSLDGISNSIKQGEVVTVSKADFMLNVIKFEDNNFLDTIRNKMMWGIDKRN